MWSSILIQCAFYVPVLFNVPILLNVQNVLNSFVIQYAFYVPILINIPILLNVQKVDQNVALQIPLFNSGLQNETNQLDIVDLSNVANQHPVRLHVYTSRNNNYESKQINSDSMTENTSQPVSVTREVYNSMSLSSKCDPRWHCVALPSAGLQKKRDQAIVDLSSFASQQPVELHKGQQTTNEHVCPQNEDVFTAITSPNAIFVPSLHSDSNKNLQSDSNQNCLNAGTQENVISSESISVTAKKFKSLKMCHLNVSGFQNKIENGILDQYLSKFDVIYINECNTENPILKDTLLENYSYVTKHKVNPRHKFKYGGVHGIMILFKNDLENVIEDIPTKAECVLWIKFTHKNGFQAIFGSVYIPCESSRFYYQEVFDELENDIIDLRSRFGLPMCLFGDFNAHTGLQDDLLCPDETIAQFTGCEMLKENYIYDSIQQNKYLTAYRYNQDETPINKNGRQIISMCQSLDMCLLNGRTGRDKFVGKQTCHKSNRNDSVIDYVIADCKMIPYLQDFYVDMFDECLSDYHCPLSLEIQVQEPQIDFLCTDTNDQKNQKDKKSDALYHENMPLTWSRDISSEFKEHFDLNGIQQLEMKLNDVHSLVESENIPKLEIETEINNICTSLNEIIINAAISSGAYKEKKGKKAKSTLRKRVPQKPWFDRDCVNARSQYYKVKNKLKRVGEKSMCTSLSKKFKNLLKSKRRNYFKKLNSKIRSLRANNSKEYWQLLNRSTEGQKIETSLSIECFYEHFKDLNKSQTQNQQDNEQNEFDSMPENEELNLDFTIEEILTVIKTLKNNKACGLDFIRNEFFKQAPHQLLEFIKNFFNLLLQSQTIPEEWCEGLIQPLYKNKGSHDDTNNYRGITLLSCLGKLFTACINKRLSSFLFDNNLIGVEQAGFRPEFSTMDHVFTLHSIIEYYKSKNGRVFCTFVDYSKAFDLINRSSLWLKLMKHGVSGRILEVIKNMYERAKSRVKVNKEISKHFSCNQGVRQGENLSPILFAVYLNDFQDTLSQQFNGLTKLTDTILEEFETFAKLYTLLYADDTIIMAESADELQNALHALKNYCCEWDLKINTSKTKIVIFSRGTVKKYPKFYIGPEEVDVVSEYTYLGVVFSCNGSFTKACKKQVVQAKKAMFGLLEKARILKLPIDITLDLFDKMILPVLTYGCEVWGISNLREVEIFHRKFMRILLNTYNFTPNCMLYGELGTLDISSRVSCRMMHFWAKLKFGKQDKLSSLLFQVMSKLFISDPNKCNFKWMKHIKDNLDQSGFGWVWKATDIDIHVFKSMYKQRCSDMFIQNWQADVASNSQCTTYKLFKKVHEFESFLQKIDPTHAYNLIKFRTRTHQLPVTKNRFNENADVSCNLCCTGDVGDEAHYLFKCDYFSNMRNKYLPSNFQTYTNENKYHKLFKIDEKNLTNLARFAKIIMSHFKQRFTRLAPRKIRKTRIGRLIVPPVKLDL